MLRRIATSVVLAGFLTGGLAIATPAYALCPPTNPHFCAWKNINYSGTKLVDSHAVRGSIIFPQEKNAVSSGKNGTSNKWCGVNEHTFVPDETIVVWSPGDQLSNLHDTGDGDQIDHFDVVAPGTSCPA